MTTEAITPPADDDRLGFFATIDSLTGYDEFAIEKAFNAEIGALSFVKQNRALVFVLLRRHRSMDDKLAKQTVMGMTQAQLVEWFSDTDEVDAEEPEDAMTELAARADAETEAVPESPVGKDASTSV